MTTATLLTLLDANEAAEVRPGWIPLLIVLGMGAFVAFLYFSLKKQLGKIDFPEDKAQRGNEDGPAPKP